MEEAVWLVARTDSEGAQGFRTMTYNDDRLTGTGAGEPDNTINMAAAAPDAPPDNESGELLDAGDDSALDHFHEDAIVQAGCGLSQLRVVVVGCLGVAGAALELSSVPFILPSAEIELCIQPYEKTNLVLMSLLGCAVGAAAWGALCSRLGRRRALVSALAVNAVFGAVAAFMPTLGTFMMARFCSAIGSGGIVPCCVTYTGEMTSRALRPRALALLAAGAGAGAAAAAALAGAMLPQTGVQALVEDKEHFSAWHRYLLVCILPHLAALVGAVWAHESPRYLLERGREVDAINTYQNIHSSNRIRLCGKGNVTSGNRAAYRLSELALPGKRHKPRHNTTVQMLWVSVFQLFSALYRRTTLCTGGVLLCTMATQVYLSSYVPGTVVHASNQLFEASTRRVQNVSIDNQHHNTTIENVQYYNVTFTNCTFRDMLISHVAFRNCSFYDVAFSNIQTSYTMFEGCLLVNTTIIDTDLELGRELDAWCVLNNTVLRGLRASCPRRADLTDTLQPRSREQKYVSYAMLVGAALALLPRKLRPTVLVCLLCLLLSPSLYFARDETALYVVEAAHRALGVLVFYNTAVTVLDTYPAHHRCAAHGLMLSVAYSGGAVVCAAGSGGATLSCVLCALLGGGATALAVRGR